MTAPSNPPPLEDPGVSRRSFIKTIGASAAASTLVATTHAAVAAVKEARAEDDAIQGPEPIDLTLKVNGKSLSAKVDPATTLLEFLRIHQGLTGPKEVCDRGACGACSVHINGKLMVSCMMLAADALGAEITTVEGLAKGDKLDPLQEAFVKHDAMQCGFCIPGFIMAGRALLNKTPKPTMAQIKRGLSGNICRCGCYTNMFNAVLEASGQPPVMDGGAR